LDGTYILEMKKLTKAFPGVIALNEVDLELQPGEVLALLGENGAGKSTLMRILAGAIPADKGDICIDGKKQFFHSPHDALEKGISVIYQELTYLNFLSVAENIFLGKLPQKGLDRHIDWRKLRSSASKILKQVDLAIDPMTEVSKLPLASKQLIEIGRALSRSNRIIVMDEPTSALAEHEINVLFAIISKLRKNGISIIYITHKLDEVFQIADRVMVLRDGQRVLAKSMDETSKEELVKAMVGRDILDMYPKADITKGEVLLDVRGLTTDKAFDVSFSVRKGEIVALFGSMGSGRGSVVEALFGAERMQSGSVTLKRKQYNPRTPRDAINAGFGYIPSERKTQGLIMGHSVKRNISTAYIRELSRLFYMDEKTEREIALHWQKRLGVRTPSIETMVYSLSGGNQQKVVIAKWMVRKTQLLILNEPTKGVDVGAKVEIYKLMEELCSQGMGIIMVSSEMPETLGIADRIVVMYEGRVIRMLNHDGASQEELMHLSLGGTN
jgi:ABC-type sugar transport system ATPase subunit